MSEKIKDAPTGLALLMVPFEPHEVGKLPKPTKAQTDAVKANFKEGVRCDICGQWHHPKVVHLDYVGHAALTKRLLQVDPHWTWEPMALTPQGAPLIDQHGGMWIRLTICGMTRIGYGHADGKTGGDAIKEVVGDALRNAALRFGAALDLWHKGDLYDLNELKDMGFDKTPVNTDATNKWQPAPEVNKLTGKLLPPPPPAPPPQPLPPAEAFATKASADLDGMLSARQMADYFLACKPGLEKLVKGYPKLWADVFIKRVNQIGVMTDIDDALNEQHPALAHIAATNPDIAASIDAAVKARRLVIDPFMGEA